MREGMNLRNGFQFARQQLCLLDPLCVLALALICGAAATTFSQSMEKASEPMRTAGWVVIPVEEYRILRSKAYPAEHDPEPPPVEATLSRVDYDLHILGDHAAGRASLTVDVLKDGWVRVPVPAGLLVREARLDGKLVSLVPGATSTPTNSTKTGSHAGQLSALLSHSGRSVLLLDVDVPVSSSAGEQSISLPSTESGVTRAEFLLQRRDIELRITGGLLAGQTEGADTTKWIAYGRGNEPLTVAWRRKSEEQHTELPLRMRGSLIQLTTLAEDSTSIYAEASFEIVQGAAREARVRLPENVTVNQVAGASIADWEVKDGELAVKFLEPVEKNARFVITGETRLPRDGNIDVPILRLMNIEREEGGVAVEVQGAGEIKGEKEQGLEDADATDLGETVANRQSPALVAFRVRPGAAGNGRSLSVNLVRYDQQAVLLANVEEARYQILLCPDGKELVEARYAVRNNQRNFVKITLPAGATVWSAALGGKPVRPGQSPDGSVLLPLEKSRGGEDAPAFAIEILYLLKATVWGEKGQAKIALPALDLPISRTGMLLYYPPFYRIAAEPGSFRQQEYANPMSAALRMAEMAESAVPVPLPMPRAEKFDKKDDSTTALLDNFRAKSSGGKVVGILPVNVEFPAFGPHVFLVSELTSENQSADAVLNFQRDKKGTER
jgi:hypothetical protein